MYWQYFVKKYKFITGCTCSSSLALTSLKVGCRGLTSLWLKTLSMSKPVTFRRMFCTRGSRKYGSGSLLVVSFWPTNIIFNTLRFTNKYWMFDLLHRSMCKVHREPIYKHKSVKNTTKSFSDIIPVSFNYEEASCIYYSSNVALGQSL